jgi:hypothetical protein
MSGLNPQRFNSGAIRLVGPAAASREAEASNSCHSLALTGVFVVTAVGISCHHLLVACRRRRKKRPPMKKMWVQRAAMWLPPPEHPMHSAASAASDQGPGTQPRTHAHALHVGLGLEPPCAIAAVASRGPCRDPCGLNNRHRNKMAAKPPDDPVRGEKKGGGGEGGRS